MMASRRIAVDTLQRALPRSRIDVSAGVGENLLASVLKSSDTEIRSLSLAMANDSIITLGAAASGISAGSTRIDSVSLSAMQHGEFLIYRAAMNNRPGTFDDFAHVDLSRDMPDTTACRLSSTRKTYRARPDSGSEPQCHRPTPQ